MATQIEYVKEVEVMRRSRDGGLSPEAKKFAQSSRVPAEIKAYLARQIDDIDAQIELYRAVSLAANTKADALLAVRRLDVVQGEAVALDEALERARLAEMHAKSIETSERMAKEEIRRLKASQAAAISSGRD